MVLRQTSSKRMRAKLRQIKQQLLARKHDPVQQPASGCARSFKATSTTTRFLVTDAAWGSFENR